MPKKIYLDYAAATPMDTDVLKAMAPYFAGEFYNPSATYLAARDVRQVMNKARSTVAGLLGTKPVEIIFTAGATEANNLAIQGLMKKHPNGQVLTSAIEHDSVLAPAALYHHKSIPVTAGGVVDTAALKKLISQDTVLISVMLVNNELGTIQPIKEIAAIVGSVRQNRQTAANRKPLYLHTDAAQAANLFDLHISRLGVDLMSLNGGKVYGPKQSGVLFVKTGINLQPLIVGGGQERNVRSGTENVAGIVGLAAALEIAQKSRAPEAKRLRALRDLFVKELTEKIPSAVVNGSPKHQSPHLAHISVPGFDNERLMMELDEIGVQVAVGSACSASNQEPSHVLKAIGVSDQLARASLRISFGRPTTVKDIKYTVQQISRLTS